MTRRDRPQWWPCTTRRIRILILHLVAMVGMFINHGLELQSVRSIMQPQLRANYYAAKATETGEFQQSSPPSCSSGGTTEERPTILLPETQDGKLIQGLRRDLTNATYEKLFSSSSAACLPTTQVQIIFPTNTSNERCNYNTSVDENDDFYWELQTFDEYGHPKTVGGDEFYITYTDQRLYESHMINISNTTTQFHMLPFTAAAWITDLHNGRYRLEFEEPPRLPLRKKKKRTREESSTPPTPDGGDAGSGSGNYHGVLAVYFQYTCQIGRMGPPTKQHWRTGGNTADIWYKTKNKVLPMAPPIRPFQYPSSSIIGREQTAGEFYPYYLKDDFDIIIPIGDSLLQQFLKPLGIRFANINQRLSVANLEKWKKTLDDRDYRNRQKKNFAQQKTAIIVDSCVWDILADNISNTTATTTTTNASSDGIIEENWEDHRLAMQEYLNYIAEKVPNATVFWKSCTGMHIQMPMLKEGKPGTNRVKYMSTSRVWRLYSIQKEVIEKEIEKRRKEQQEASFSPPTTPKQRLFFLDLYSAYYLSSNCAQDGDGRHYIPGLDREVVSWFATNASTASYEYSRLVKESDGITQE